MKYDKYKDYQRTVKEEINCRDLLMLFIKFLGFMLGVTILKFLIG